MGRWVGSFLAAAVVVDDVAFSPEVAATAGNTILMSVAVTQSCRTGLFSKSSALGRSANVEKAILKFPILLESLFYLVVILLSI
jgi:hypothetical protein